jgi:hypothetical protein
VEVCVVFNLTFIIYIKWFVKIVVSVQYRAIAAAAYDAFYKLTNPREQIRAYVYDGKLLFFFKCLNTSYRSHFLIFSFSHFSFLIFSLTSQ